MLIDILMVAVIGPILTLVGIVGLVVSLAHPVALLASALAILAFLGVVSVLCQIGADRPPRGRDG